MWKFEQAVLQEGTMIGGCTDPKAMQSDGRATGACRRHGRVVRPECKCRASGVGKAGIFPVDRLPKK